MAVSLFTVLPIELYKFCISLQLTLTKDMASLIGGKSIGVSAEQSLTAISSLKVGTGLLIFLLIMMGYSIIIRRNISSPVPTFRLLIAR